MNFPHINLLDRRPHFGPDPARDWLIVLAATLVLLIVSVGANLFFYQQAIDGLPLEGVAPSTTPVNPDLIGRVEQVFETRATESDKYENGAYYFIDPSK